MGFSIKEELEKIEAPDLLPQNLPQKFLAILGLRVDEFLQQYADFDESPETADDRIQFHPDILDIVTKIYVAVNGDHTIDTSDVQNILRFNEAINHGAIYYCMAVFRESVGRDSGIQYETPELSTILTKPPEAYDCHHLMDHIRKHNCETCGACGSDTNILPQMPK